MEALVYVIVAFMLCGCAFGRECTNTPTQSHTLRHELGASKNETWKKEVMAHYHVTPTDDSAWADLLPRKFLSEEHQRGWSVMYRNIKNLGVFKPPVGFLKEVPLEDVRLLEGSVHAVAQQTNLEYLLMLDVDRLIWSFRKTAGLPTPGKPYGGWESFNVELRGHFVGHYLSASALMWASTKNDSLKEKMSALVTGLSACQEKIGTGYLSAFPDEFFDRFEAIEFVWAPYYTIHKIMDGLLDQHVKAGNPQALKMLTWMVDYFYSRVMNVIAKYTVHRHYDSLNEETGGMNDALYKLYSITANDIAGFHSNTQIPVVVDMVVIDIALGQENDCEFPRFIKSEHDRIQLYVTYEGNPNDAPIKASLEIVQRYVQGNKKIKIIPRVPFDFAATSSSQLVPVLTSSKKRAAGASRFSEMDSDAQVPPTSRFSDPHVHHVSAKLTLGESSGSVVPETQSDPPNPEVSNVYVSVSVSCFWC